MTDGSLHPADLIDLPRQEREVAVYLARMGPTDPGMLARTIGRDAAAVGEALAALARKGHVRESTDGRVQLVFGRNRRRTLPARLLPALLPAERFYSAQDVAVLHVALPILRFARGKSGEMVDHGEGHAMRVKSFASQLGYIMALTRAEHQLLRAAALFHDIGNAVDRARHHIISQEMVAKLEAAGELPFSDREAALVGLLCRWHRGDYRPDQQDTLRGEPIRTGLLASILRIADAMDIDHRRSDYADEYAHVIARFFPDQVPHWSSVREILGVRLRCSPAVTLQVFKRGHAGDDGLHLLAAGCSPEVQLLGRGQGEDNRQVGMLRQDLAATPLDWSVQVRRVDPSAPAAGPSADGEHAAPADRWPALLAFPFDPHSLVMAALSRKHLAAAGYAVETLCYPDTAGGPAWLWREALLETDPAHYSRLVVIGDRPDAAVTQDLPRAIDRWQAAGAAISVLNRHEANWPRLPDLLRRSVDVVIGGDVAYFWGDAVSEADLWWGRIAALCTRDPTQASVGLTVEEQRVTWGLLDVVHRAYDRSPQDGPGWAALVEPIMDRIAADDRGFFADRAADPAAALAAVGSPGRVEGRVLLLEPPPDLLPRAYYWAMEAAIERHGRKLERSIRFNVPYAIATWPDGEAVELLAISHWREEEAIPIRLLYPTDLGQPPEGHESAIRVRLPADQAATVVDALLAACNGRS